jgi:uncharacterized protein
MNENHTKKISEELKLKMSQVQSVCTLLEEGATIPFIARYRKEATGSLDEVAVAAIRDRLLQLKELCFRGYLSAVQAQAAHKSDHSKGKRA